MTASFARRPPRNPEDDEFLPLSPCWFHFSGVCAFGDRCWDLHCSYFDLLSMFRHYYWRPNDPRSSHSTSASRNAFHHKICIESGRGCFSIPDVPGLTQLLEVSRGDDEGPAEQILESLYEWSGADRGSLRVIKQADCDPAPRGVGWAEVVVSGRPEQLLSLFELLAHLLDLRFSLLDDAYGLNDWLTDAQARSLVSRPTALRPRRRASLVRCWPSESSSPGPEPQKPRLRPAETGSRGRTRSSSGIQLLSAREQPQHRVPEHSRPCAASDITLR